MLDLQSDFLYNYSIKTKRRNKNLARINQHFLQVACFGTTTSVANIACKYGTLLGADINRVVHIILSPVGEIGRHEGLKIPFRKECRFESGTGHQIEINVKKQLQTMMTRLKIEPS